MDILRRSFGNGVPGDPDPLTFVAPTYPLSENSGELHSLLAGWVNVTGTGLPSVDEDRAYSIPAFARGVEIIAGVIAGLPLRTYRKDASGLKTEVGGIFDDPTGPAEISVYQWVEMLLMHLVGHREAYLQELRNDGGALIGYWPIHPGAVTKVAWSGLSKRYTVHFNDGDRDLGTPTDPTDDGAILQILGPNTKGLRGRPLWEQYRSVFQSALAGQESNARTFTGPSVRGLVSLDESEEFDTDDPGEEAKLIMEQLNAKVSGPANAGQLAFVNRHLKFQDWNMSNVDAERAATWTMTLEDFARMNGIPPHLLAMIDKQTSWGTGISEQNIGLARYTLMNWTSRIESALRTVQPPGVFSEFDYKGLFQGAPEQEINLLLAQTGGLPLLSQDEARLIMNRGPMPQTEAVSDEAEDSEDSGTGSGSDTGADA